MSSKDTPKDTQRMKDMVSYATEAVHMLGDGDAGKLVENRMLYLAVSRLVEIVGEAASKVSNEVRQAHPEIEWRDAANMRNILAHEYGRIDYGILADTIRDSLPILIAQINKILKDETP
jgi:uncharacterized protein with HEPN domain